MDSLKGQMKNQTVKKDYVVVVYIRHEDDHAADEVYSADVKAESIREAVRLVSSALNNS